MHVKGTLLLHYCQYSNIKFWDMYYITIKWFSVECMMQRLSFSTNQNLALKISSLFIRADRNLMKTVDQQLKRWL